MNTAPSSLPYDSYYYFFGEDYRTCFDHLHIIDGAKVIVLLDIVKCLVETVFFGSYTGYLDAFVTLNFMWVVIGYCGCVVGFIKQRYYYFFPYTTLKVVECLTSFVLIVILIFTRSGASNLLLEILRWKYPHSEDDKAFNVVLFVAVASLLIANLIVFNIIVRSQLYYRRRSGWIYKLQRQVLMRRIIV